MRIRTQGSLFTSIILFAFMVAGCQQQPSASPTSAASPASATPATTNGTAAASNTNASSSPDKGQINACKLLTGDEIKSVQGDSLKDVTPNAPSGGDFITSQCFYATNSFVNSISLTVTQQNAQAGARNIREFWEETFDARSREKERERERDRDKKAKGGEEEEESAPPERVKGIGDDAYSVGNAKIGALYVLKGDKFLRISVGGSHSQPERIAKMKKLAQYAINRL
ncbi:MAG TPA: hypothetical protein VIF81_03925 [Pyrinomonadaceae bacterium]|jgi:hypothetical protein